MKKQSFTVIMVFFFLTNVCSQTEPNAGAWKTWFIVSGKAHRLPNPGDYKSEIQDVIAAQGQNDAAMMQQINFWNAGAPGFRWQELIGQLWMSGGSTNGALANMLVGVATYDATIVAWDSKFSVKRPRPFEADKKIKALVPKPESPSFPCEHSVAAGAAATIIAYYFPDMKDSVNRMAERVMKSRIAAGVAFPSDTRAGFELGKRIAEIEIEKTKDFATKKVWDGKVPDKPGLWNGKNPMLPMAGFNKTVVLDSSSQYRPGPPPDFAKDMAELKNFKPNFRSQANAFLYAAQSPWDDVLNMKMFEYNIHLNPPRAARIYAVLAIGMYDGFTACWDAKYAYWGIRPNQFDTTYKPPLFFTPPFPGYPSGHAALGAVMAEIYSHFFPADSSFFRKRAIDGAESRFQGGIHFRTDNDVALVLGKKVGEAIVRRVKADGAD